MGKPAIKQLSDKIGILTDNGITETSLSEAIKNDRVKLDDNTLLTCIIRQDPSTGIWGFVEDTVHEKQHVVSISQDANKITVNYDQKFGKIKYCASVVDDVLNKTPYVFGTDVGDQFVNITIGQYLKQEPVSGLIFSGAGNTLTASNGVSTPSNGITDMSYANGVITINHDSVLAPYITPTIINHGDPKFGVVPSQVTSTQTQLTLRRRKRAKVAFLNVSAGVVSVDSSSDSGFSIISNTSGDLRIGTPSTDGMNYNVECSALGILATVYSITATNMYIKFYDTINNVQLTTIPNCFIVITRTDAGALPTILTSGDVGFYFSRPKGYLGSPVNPSTPMPIGNNVWVFGLFAKL